MTLVSISLAALGVPTWAAGPADWAFTIETSYEIRLPAAIVQAVEFGELDYEGPPYRSAESATYTTFVYEAGRYVRRTSIELQGAALEQLVQELRRVPRR